MIKSKSGFTLIEVLVVLGIIGVLLAVLTVSFTEARQQSRDKIRMSTLKEVELALELYKAQNGRYPEMGCSAPTGDGGHVWSGEIEWTAIAWQYGCEDYISGLTPDFISILPKDTSPNSSAGGFIYTTNTPGTAYKLMSHRDVESLIVQSYDNEFARCPYSCGMGSNCPATADPIMYAVYSPGAECW